MGDHSETRRSSVAILGVRGVPAAHGGFETFAAKLAKHLAAVGWNVSVYCQEDLPDVPDVPDGQSIRHSTWEGVRRIHIEVGPDTPVNSIRFDWRCISHVIKNRPDVVLILGYNTAIFSARLRLAGVPMVINMDGIEWRRAKWGAVARAWLYMNDWAGCLLANRLIADHPQIKRHLRSRVRPDKITVIPYGTDLLEVAPDDTLLLAEWNLVSGHYATMIARPEPENSVLEIVEAFSAKTRGIKLVVLGNYQPSKVQYHRKVQAAASAEVVFLGAIYEKTLVDTLRRNGLFYVHGHRVGGCNPSLLEAMGAGNAVLAHNNRFNRWVAKDGAIYFSDREGCERAIDLYVSDPADRARRGDACRRRADKVFHWSGVLHSYSALLTDASAPVPAGIRETTSIPEPFWELDADAP